MPLEDTSVNKYLGFPFDEFMNYENGIKLLADSAGRALGSVVNKLKIGKDLGYSTYSQLYDACVSPIVNYAAGVQGFIERRISDAVQNKAIRCFLGILKYVPSLAAQGDMGWIPGTVTRKFDMIRLWNRFINMSDDRINKKVFLWSKVQNSPWARDSCCL